MKQAMLLFLVPVALLAQTTSTASITGVVSDPAKSSIPNASVTVTNTETEFVRRAKTDPSGIYRIDLLPPGSYRALFEFAGFTPRTILVKLNVGALQRADAEMTIESRPQSVEIQETATLDTERSQQASLINAKQVQQLPIDRRDYLSFSLLAPGVSDSKALADANSFRVKQTPDSGLSFYGSNGRGNVVNVDGGESNDGGGGVRPTISQEAVREFQVNRSNYSAEYGGSRGGVVNIVTKSGTNQNHGSAFAFFRNQNLDATNPFSVVLQSDNTLRRVKPDSSRQQFGASFGGPVKKDKTFYFLAYEQLRRRETNAVPILTDLSVFGPTRAQKAILAQLPPSAAAQLTAALSTPASVQSMFAINSGVFPFQTDQYQGLARIDHQFNENNQTSLRVNTTNLSDTNPNVSSLTGYSRGYVQNVVDITTSASWIHTFNPLIVNEARAQFNYDKPATASNDPFGPALEIAGYGNFNRDRFLPSTQITRHPELVDNVTLSLGKHTVKTGAYALIRAETVDSKTFMSGRFTFGPLPGGLVNPVLASTSITALQAFNLGLAQSFQQGFGNGVVKSTHPLYAGYLQDDWRISSSLTVNAGVRYEFDKRHDPLPSGKTNFAPRVGFAWSPDKKTVIRGGYGFYFATIDFQVDYSVDALGVRANGSRQIAQVLTTIQSTDPRQNSLNIFQTLRAQGVIGIPTPTRSITPADLTQFGINVSYTGALPPLTVIFKAAPNYKNPQTRQASFGVERELALGFTLSASGIYVRGLHLTNSYDDNLLFNAPFSAALGTQNYAADAAHPGGYFVNPFIYQSNVYTSDSNSFYGGLLVETAKRIGSGIQLHANYTLSHATDETTDYNTDFQPNNQWCRRCDRASSSFDERHKFVAYAMVASPVKSNALLRDWNWAPIYRYRSGRPFNLLVGGSDLNNDRHNTTDRPAYAGRNTGLGPSFWTFDTRIQRSLPVTERMKLNVTIEAFNLFNKLNFGAVNNTVGAYAGPFNATGRDDRRPTDPLGFTSAFEPRRIQIGMRLTF